ncbi:NLRC3, partial [Symbiodinium natans]
EPPQPVASTYKLGSKEDFVRYLHAADIKLVRGAYLKKLLSEGRVWPRRQEAEDEADALYRPELTEDFKFVGVSHAWESMEHPDPCGFQLRQIVDHARRHHRYFFDECFFFIDYMSLYQYKRNDQGQEEAFRHAMKAMHLFYANSSSDFCSVWRVERLTPASCWRRELKAGRTVPVYDEVVGAVVEKQLSQLTRNTTPYSCRGWCCAEVEWSRPIPKQQFETF